MGIYRHGIRPLLFRRDAEDAHAAALRWAGLVGRRAVGRALLRGLWGGPPLGDPRLAATVAGVHLPAPVGLAAGFDKSGVAVPALSCLGFGAVEVGSVSAEPSVGNPRPRLFRLPADEAIVVNYGVPNDGADVVARRLAGAPRPVPVGVNLVETNRSGTDAADLPPTTDGVVAELVTAARPFPGVVDMLTVNLNCPNTTAGRSPFDDAGAVRALLQDLAAVPGLPPLYLKFTAHTDAARCAAFLAAVDPFPGVAGFVFNLPPGTGYPLRTPATRVAELPGTLCGAPTRTMMDVTLAFWYERIDRTRHVLVGSGGIRDADDAWRKITLGASWLQVYSALVFRGPALAGRLHRGLLARLQRAGLDHLSQAVGLAHRTENAA